jgi:hypothetical protein
MVKIAKRKHNRSVEYSLAQHSYVITFYHGGALGVFYYFKIHCVNNKAMKNKGCSEWC